MNKSILHLAIAIWLVLVAGCKDNPTSFVPFYGLYAFTDRASYEFSTPTSRQEWRITLYNHTDSLISWWSPSILRHKSDTGWIDAGSYDFWSVEPVPPHQARSLGIYVMQWDSLGRHPVGTYRFTIEYRGDTSIHPTPYGLLNTNEFQMIH